MPNSPSESPTCVELIQGGTAPDLGTAKQFKLKFLNFLKKVLCLKFDSGLGLAANLIL